MAEDYFEVLGVQRRLALDEGEAQRRFYERSRQLHPDRFAGRSPQEQQQALDATALLNDAWRTLRDPIKRAEYVLSTEGLDVSEQRSKDVPPELLEEVFELNMALEELRGGDESVRPQLESSKLHFVELQNGIDAELARLGQQYDAGGGRETLTVIRGVLNRRRYIRNLIREVEKELNVHVSN